MQTNVLEGCLMILKSSAFPFLISNSDLQLQVIQGVVEAVNVGGTWESVRKNQIAISGERVSITAGAYALPESLDATTPPSC